MYTGISSVWIDFVTFRVVFGFMTVRCLAGYFAQFGFGKRCAVPLWLLRPLWLICWLFLLKLLVAFRCPACQYLCDILLLLL